MPTQKASITKKEKPDNRQVLLDLIGKEYGSNSVVVMERALKNQDKQIDAAMHTHGMSLEDIAGSKGIDLGKIGVVKPQVTPPTPQQPQQQAQPQPPPQTQGSPKQVLQQLIQSKPASSPFGFGGMSEQGGQIIEQEPGVLAGLLSTLITGNPKTSARMDMQKLAGAGNMRQHLSGIASMSDLTPDQQIQAVSLARKVAGVRGAEKLVPSIVASLREGKTIDQVEDNLRMSGQSSGFNGSLRNAAQQIMAGESSTEKQSTFDDLDDLNGNPTQQMEYLKRIAIKKAPASDQNLIMGKERTIEFLNEIKEDLKILKKNGINTGFLEGNYENLLARAGQVSGNGELRKIAIKVATAVINFRRYATGVNFSVPENRDYVMMFPSINKVGKFNDVSIEALNETFTGDLDKFYSMSMGRDNYKKLSGVSEKKSFNSEEEAMTSGVKGEVIINGRRARID
jgi:hypothetical protein